MQAEPPSDFEWPESWMPIADEKLAKSLLAELVKEVGRNHRLFERAVEAVAFACQGDDVLFLTNDPAWPLAAVHLTWRGGTESDPTWPATTFFSGWEDWKGRFFKAQNPG